MDKHDSLLICCGSPDLRQQLRENLSKRYHLLETTNSRQAVFLLKQNISCIAAFLLDISQPEALDLQMLRQYDNKALLHTIPSIILAKEDTPELLQTALSLGAADVIPLDYDPAAMLHRVENVVELHLHKQYLETMLTEQTKKIRQTNETLVDALSSIIEHRSVESGQHILRIRHFTKILLEEVGHCCPEYQLDAATISVISSASALHDIGKIAIPDAILMKPGRLTNEEREVMKTHAVLGCQILDSVGTMGDPVYMRYAHNICHYHHERWDGGGYPNGLSGDAIPICAQVVGLADVYDALTSKRVYKDAYSYSQAVNMILKGECGMFSPKLLECFKHVTSAYENLAKAYGDGLQPETKGFDPTLLPPARQAENSLERVRAKYYTLVHYINGLLIEVDLNNGLFHLIYNPYPELMWLKDATSFSEIFRMLFEKVLMPEERKKMKHFFRKDIPSFLSMDLRRSTHHFRIRSDTHPDGEIFEFTLLRINPIDASRRTLAVLCRRVSEPFFREQAGEPAQIMSDSTYLCRNDQHFTLIRLGRHIAHLAGYTEEEIRTQYGNRLMDMVLPEDRAALHRTIQEQLSRGIYADAEFRVRHKQGHIIWVLDKSRLCLGSDGKEYLNSFLTDISHTKKAYEALYNKLQRYEIILAQTENALFEWDIETDTLTFSETWDNIFGFAPYGLSGKTILSSGAYFHPDDLPLLLDSIANLENGSQYETVEVRTTTSRGRYIWCRFRASALRDDNGALQKVVGIIINIDTEKQAAQKLQERAERDALTKLLNKNAAQRQSEDYLSRFPGSTQCAMLIIDLDNFKQINDRYGHLFGDSVLTKVAREIEKLFRSQDIVARIGGDEFMVLMQGVSDRALLEQRCRQLLLNLENFIVSQNTRLALGCSIGIALSPDHGVSYFDLFRHADLALYHAKAIGKNTFVFYDKTSSAFHMQDLHKPGHNTPIESDVELGLAEDNLVRYAFQRLYAADNVEWAVNDILALVGRKMNVSRVYVFENSEDNQFCSNTFEWCNSGISPEIDNLQNISYRDDIPGYMESFNEQDLLYCSDIRELPPAVYDILAPQSIKSMLHCAIRENGIFRGYVGFDDCVENRFWTKDQIQTLRYFSEMLGVFLLKHREHLRSLHRAANTQSILDNQNAWIYIIDPDTCTMKYLNAKTRLLAPDVEVGMCCYKSLMGLDSRCPGCPSKDIRTKKNDCTQMYNSHFHLSVIAEATLIQMDGEECCLMTCRELHSSSIFPEENTNCNS